jgi:predicted lactoylglutathione lyase
MINLLVLRTNDIEKTSKFFNEFGLNLEYHSHGGQFHYGSEINGFVFEIYPITEKTILTKGLRIGFQVENMDELMERLMKYDIKIISKPKMSEWGYRCVINDFDGHVIELLQKIKL